MWIQEIAAAAEPANAVDLNWVVAIATAAATLGGFLGLWVAHRQARRSDVQQQRQDIQAQVSKEVEAKIGTVLMSLRALEEDARQRLAELSINLDNKQRQLTFEVETKEAALRKIVERSAEQAQSIEELLQRAGKLIPLLEASEFLPMQLLSEMQHASDAATKTAYLIRILEHPDSDPKALEIAGDIARQELLNRSLASRLYRRAFEIDPEHVATRAEYLHLMAYNASERAHARDEIVSLAKAHPSHHTVVNAMVNFFIGTNDFAGLLKAASELLPVSSESSLLWRNIAVAREKLNMRPDDIEEAYERALQTKSRSGYVNTARPYAKYLIDKPDLEKAALVLRRSLTFDPSEGELHILKAELHLAREEYEEAAVSYKWATELGDHADKIVAGRRLRDLLILKQLGLQPAAGVDLRSNTGSQSL